MGQLVPNIVHHVKEEVEARNHKEKEQKICKEMEVKERLVCKEAERLVKEEAEWITQREQHQQEKLDLFLSESITVEEFERDSEVEGERSKVLGDIVGKDTIGTQVSEMEVDNMGEDEVAVEDKRLRGGRKWALSSPPKPSRKWLQRM